MNDSWWRANLTTEEALSQGEVDIMDLIPDRDWEPLTPEERESLARASEQIELKVAYKASEAKKKVNC
jgi:hypothetical protein